MISKELFTTIKGAVTLIRMIHTKVQPVTSRPVFLQWCDEICVRTFAWS